MLLDRFRAKERLTVEVKPATKVFCVHCNSHIYYLKSDGPAELLRTAKNYVPASDEIPQPETGEWRLCPLCHKPFYAVMENDCKIKTDKGYLP